MYSHYGLNVESKVPETFVLPLHYGSIKVCRLLVTDPNAYMILFAFGRFLNRPNASY